MNTENQVRESRKERVAFLSKVKSECDEKMKMVEGELGLHCQLTTTRCSGSQTLLHIVAWFNYSQVVSMLIDVSPTINNQGMNPVHVTLMNGSLNVLRELLELSPLCTLERLDGGLTIFHLCVRHYHLSALELMFKKLTGFVEMQDDQGETPLHLAVRLRKLDKVEHLIKKTNIDPPNTERKRPDSLSSGIGENGLRMSMMHSISSPNDECEWFPKKRDSLIVVVGLIATMAFQATGSPPGGVWQEDAKDKKVGEAMMGHNRPKAFVFFMVTNIIAFITSLTTLLLLCGEVPFKNRRSFMRLLEGVMFISLIAVSFTYMSPVSMIIPEIKKGASYTTIVSGMYIWMTLVTP